MLSLDSATTALGGLAPERSTQSWVEFCPASMQRSVEQMGLDVDRESVTSPAQHVMVPCETAMYEGGMASSNQPFCDASDQMAVNMESYQCAAQ